jgi:hypothetical protein
MDRAYRFGQTRDVSVFRLLGAGSVEELIYARQLYKQQQMTIGYDASIQTRFGFSNRIYIVLTLKPHLTDILKACRTTRLDRENSSVSRSDYA